MIQQEHIDEARLQIDALRQGIEQHVVGHNEVVQGVLAALLAGGHVLLEGVPGLGKTVGEDPESQHGSAVLARAVYP